MERNYGIPVISIVRLDDLLAYLEERPAEAGALEAIRAYRQQYGIQA